MKDNAIKISANFRKMALRSVLAIVLFLFTYVAMVGAAIGFTILCGYCGFLLVSFYAHWITAMLGLGLISLGILILIFLIKFTFKSSKTDRSHLHEITAAEEPELFVLINTIATEVHTSYPKKVYLSADVNAAVFYDSSFWSMFLPIRKNLIIGLGLMNSSTTVELKAILAHEFGHFSQRSMKLGSFVYNVNKVIYNLLYDNESFKEMLGNWARISNYFALFVQLAGIMIQGIQWILMKVYQVVNINYMGLSREMEFHADAIAAEVTGSQPLISSLMRMELAEDSLNSVFMYYENRIAEGEKTRNFYPQQSFLMNFSAQKNELPVNEGLPEVSVETFKRFKRSRLILKDQWSSHPAIEERVAELMRLNKPVKELKPGLAIDILVHRKAMEEQFTAKLFEGVTFAQEPVFNDDDQFSSHFSGEYEKTSYPPLYKGYYDVKNVLTDRTDISFEKAAEAGIPRRATAESLFDSLLINDLNTLTTMENDLLTLEHLSAVNSTATSFDYDGQKYTTADIPELTEVIKTELKMLQERISERDEEIFSFFVQTATQANRLEEFREKHLAYQEFVQLYEIRINAYAALFHATAFIQTQTPFSQIRTNMQKVYELEKPLKTEIEAILTEEPFQYLITAEMKDQFEAYIGKERLYFSSLDVYFDEELKVLFQAMGDYYRLIQQTIFDSKKNLLVYQASLNGSYELTSEGINM